MKPFLSLCLSIVLIALSMPGPLSAAPGAHGPNGEHLDDPVDADAVQDGRPRMEAFSELFELVAHLEHDALVMMINVYASNAPVAAALVELDGGGLRVQAEFDPATGAYRFAAPELLAALSEPGTHPLAFSIDSGDEFDIVAGALIVAEHDHPADAGRVGWWLAASGALALTGWVVFKVRRRRWRSVGISPHPAGVLS